MGIGTPDDIMKIDPQTGERKLGSIEEQTGQALKNISEILKAAAAI